VLRLLVVEVEDVERLLVAVAGEVVAGVDDDDGEDVDVVAPQPARARTSHTISAAAPAGRLGIPYLVTAAIERETSSTGWTIGSGQPS
jgi:hypothetical protein